MHMADALLSPAVGGIMNAVSAGAIVLSIKKTAGAQKEKQIAFDDKKIPVMAVMGAFVFAGQMINFTIPGTGSSGHIGGGIMLAAVLGPFPALLTLAAVLIIQCLFFADGGLFAYGCNLFNLGVCMCLFAYQIIYKPIIKKWGFNRKTIFAASVISATAGLQAGAFAVVLETSASGVTSLPFGTFAALMQPIHLAIGIVEGLITGAVLCFIYSVRPEILDCAENAGSTERISLKKLVLFLALISLLTGGIFSIFASQLPDGLEWSVEKTEEIAGTGESEDNAVESAVHTAADNIVNATAVMPDYEFAGAGIVGSAITVVLAGGIGLAIRAAKNRKIKIPADSAE